MVGAVPQFDPFCAPAPARRRIMIVSARIGGGHDATGRALLEVVQEHWPGSVVRWVDTLDTMGPGVGPAFCWIYAASVERAPWLYEVFYAATWRFRWFAAASKRFTGSWAGRRLARIVDAFDPEVVLSTYPLGSAGLAWLRRHRGLTVPTAAWVSDFAPHPFWVYADVDRTYVVHETALAAARLADPAASVSVSALPVRKAFRPGHAAAARAGFGLRPDAFVVLVSCGTFAFGVSESMVRSVLATDDRIQLVVACGRNQVALNRLERLGFGSDRLVALGWIDDMAALNQAADVVVTNAGGATALEAVASGRPVFMVDPIPAHGTANASLMAVAGLAEMCASEEQLATRLRGILADRDRILVTGSSSPARPARPHRDIVPDLEAVLRLVRPTRANPLSAKRAAARRRPLPAAPPSDASSTPSPMRPADAFFAHVEQGGPSQEIGVVIDLDPPVPGDMIDAGTVRSVVAERVANLPPLRWQPVRHGHRLGWILRSDLNIEAHIDDLLATTQAEVAKAVDEFFSERMRYDRPPWQMLLVRRTDDAHAKLLIKVHHCLGDGLSALGLLEWLLDPLSSSRRPDTGSPAAIGKPRHPRPRAADAKAAARGLLRLAVHGRAPRHPLNETAIDPDRTVILVPLPLSELRAAARRHKVRTYELAIGVVAETLDRLLRPAGLVVDGRPLRAIVPLSAGRPGGDQISGNWTTAVPVDLPMGPMSTSERLLRIKDEMRRGVASGAPVAAGLVMQVAGRLPAWAHAWFARHSYSEKFLNLIVSFVPGPRGPRSLAGAPVRALYPIAPLTRQVPITFGVVTAETTAGVGILAERGLGLEPALVRATMRAAYHDLLEP